MKWQIFCIFDTKARVWGRPFYDRSLIEGERTFRSAAQDTSTNLYKYPSDYELYNLGTFDDETGQHDTSGQSFMLSASQAQ